MVLMLMQRKYVEIRRQLPVMCLLPNGRIKWRLTSQSRNSYKKFLCVEEAFVPLPSRANLLNPHECTVLEQVYGNVEIVTDQNVLRLARCRKEKSDRSQYRVIFSSLNIFFVTFC